MVKIGHLYENVQNRAQNKKKVWWSSQMSVETFLSDKIQNGRHMFMDSKNTHDTFI